MLDTREYDFNSIIRLAGVRAVELGLAKAGTLPVYDGVADEAAYFAQKLRVAWILKEPWDGFDEKGNPCGGGWSLVKDAFYKDDAWRNPVWQKIAYVMRGFRAGLTWEQMPRIRDAREMIHEIRSIAWLNVNKMPSLTNSSNGRFVRLYNEVWRDVLRRQIEVFDPRVMIFARTFGCFQSGEYKDAVLEERFSNRWVKFYRHGSRVLLDTYHPGRKGGAYVNALIDALGNAAQEKRM